VGRRDRRRLGLPPLGVTPSYADQMVRVLRVEAGRTGKRPTRVLVIASRTRAKEALTPGADYAGSSDEYIKKISEERWFRVRTPRGSQQRT